MFCAVRVPQKSGKDALGLHRGARVLYNSNGSTNSHPKDPPRSRLCVALSCVRVCARMQRVFTQYCVIQKLWAERNHCGS